MAEDVRNNSTVRIHPPIRNQFTDGIYSWPLTTVGYLIRSRGQKLRFIASLKMVNEPLIRAWLAIMAAPVDITMPNGSIHCGIMA